MKHLGNRKGKKTYAKKEVRISTGIVNGFFSKNQKGNMTEKKKNHLQG